MENNFNIKAVLDYIPGKRIQSVKGTGSRSPREWGQRVEVQVP